MKIITQLVVFIFLYIVPLLIFLFYSRKQKKGWFGISIIGVLYLIFSIPSMNFLPFILVVISIIYLRAEYMKNVRVKCEKEENIAQENLMLEENDYAKYKFDFRDFHVIKAFLYGILTLSITTSISVLFYAIFNFFKFEFKQQEVVTQMVRAPFKELLFSVPTVIIFAPILEEFVFRWFFFEKIFYRRLGVYLGALLSSLIFALVHFNLGAFPILMVIGLINCYLIHKKGYWYAVFNHLFFNLISTVSLIFNQ